MENANAFVPEIWTLPEPASGPGFSALIGAGLNRGLVPVFRAGERDRGRFFAAGTVSFASGRQILLLDARAEALVDTWPDGRTVSGPGDLELGTLATHSLSREESPSKALDVSAGWRVKLPDARDQGELGTDETDIALLAGVGGRLGPVGAHLLGGLAILGNPLRYASQDDVPFLALTVCGPPEGLIQIIHPEARIAWAFETSRNPARGEANLGLTVGRRWRVGIDGGAGLVPASPDVRASFWVGYYR